MKKITINAIPILFFVIAILPLQLFAQNDLGAIGLHAPAQPGCYGNAQTVTIKIKNYSAGAHNFTTVPVTVNASVSGPNATSFPAVVVNTGTLAAGDTMNVVIVTNYNMSAIGAYVFSANTSFAGDVNTSNNAMSPVTVNAQTLSAGTVTSDSAAYCNTGGNPILTLSGGGGGIIQWQESSTGIAGSWTNVGTNNTTYTPSSSITATRYYRAYRTCNGAGDTTATKIIPFANPQLLTVTSGSVCGTGTVTLGATTAAGNTIYWSATAGGTILGTGNTFVTPSISTSSNFYANAWASVGTVDVGIKPSDFAVCGSPVSSTVTDYPLRFTTTKPLTINSAYVIPSQAGAVTIALRMQGSTVNITTASFVFTTAQIGSPQLINLSIFIPVAGNYQLVNTSGGLWRISAPACSYPFVSPYGSMTITGSANSSVGATSTSFYNGFYQVNINEGCMSAPSPVMAQVMPSLTITQQPVNVSTCIGSTVYLVVGAQGSNLNYVWRKNGTNIPNSDNDTLAFTPVALSDAGNYDVIISGSCGQTTTSSTITMTVAPTCAWVGGQSNEWNKAANWGGGLPTSESDVSVTAGTPFQPLIASGTMNVKSLTINTGATVTINSGAGLTIYGDFVNSGTFNAVNASVNFKGLALQNIGSMTAGNVSVNGSGFNLNGAMTVNQSLILTNGNITLGTNNLTINQSAAGNMTSHIVTNSSGGVIAKNINNNAFTIPVGPSANSYNPVIINNGGSRDYFVKVVIGLSTPISNPAIAVNRTWTINPSTNPTSPANVTLQYEDSHLNAMGQPTSPMDIGVYDGSNWDLTLGVIPTGTATARQVSFNTTKFGPVAVANVNGVVNVSSVPATLDPNISSVKLLPGIVNSNAVLKVTSTKSLKTSWNVIDANGRVVMSFDKAVLSGENDIQLMLQHLPGGIYILNGTTGKGLVATLRFVKQ